MWYVGDIGYTCLAISYNKVVVLVERQADPIHNNAP